MKLRLSAKEEDFKADLELSSLQQYPDVPFSGCGRPDNSADECASRTPHHKRNKLVSAYSMQEARSTVGGMKHMR